jgi:hypothetical protein
MSDTAAGSMLTPERPWLGLRSFTEATRGYFFGRDAELADLYERVVHRSLTVCYGQSGQGKTSLMNAGLVPRLRETGWLPVPVRASWGDDDPDIETQVLTELRKALQAAPLPRWRSLADFPADVSLWELLHDPKHRLVFGAPGSTPWRLVFLFDQFEEIFTLGARRRDRADTWREALADLIENRLPTAVRARLQHDTALLDRFDLRAFHVRFVLTLRHDYLHALERWRRYVPSLLDNRFELRALNGRQALEAVVFPGRLRSGENPIVDDATGAAIVRFVASAPPEKPLAEIEAVPPLLSLICAELNAQRLALDGNHIYFDPFFGEPPALREFIESSPTNADGVREPIARTVAERELVGHGLTPREVQESFDRLIDKGLLQPEGEGESERLHLSAELMKFAGRGGTDILQAFYAGCFTGLPGTVRLWVEDTLLSPEGFRQTLNYDTALAGLRNVLTGAADADRALDQLITSRLLIAEEHGEVRRVELTHDILAPIVRESRERRRQVEARERAHVTPSQSRTIRGERRATTGESAELFWDRLMFFIERRNVALVIGGKALLIEPDGQPFDSALAQRLGIEMGLTFATDGPPTLDELMLAARRRSVDRARVIRAMRHVLRTLDHTARSRTADALAAIDSLRTFVVASFDSLVESALRNSSPAAPAVLEILEGGRNERQDVPAPETRLVAYVAGRPETSYKIPLTTGELLELWLNVSELNPPVLQALRSRLRDQSLLFLGIDWTNPSFHLLPRLLRGADGFGLASFVDDSRSESVSDVMLLDSDGAVEWVSQPVAPFIEELVRRIRATSPPPAAAAASEPVPYAPGFTVFVSYAREDLQSAERVVRQLQEVGIDVWFDRAQLTGGDSFIQETRRAIDECSLFVSLISKASTRQSQALFILERKLAAERAGRIEGRLFYIPLLLDDVEPPFRSEPHLVNQLQWARAPEGRLAPDVIQMFIHLVREARRDRIS